MPTVIKKWCLRSMFVDRLDRCPVCACSKHSGVIKSLNYFDKEKIESIWVHNPHDFFFPFYKCAKCKTYYTKEYVEEKYAKKLYSLLNDNLFGVDELTYHQIQSSYAAMIDSYIGSDFKKKQIDYFEIGPDHGILSQIINDKVAAIKNSFFVESNKSCWPSLLKLKPAKLKQDYEDIDVLNQSVDLVVAVHVLDHILKPQSFLDFVSKRLRTGGKIFIVVHDGQSFLRQLMGRKWPPFCVHHPQIFNDSAMKMFLEENGFKNIEVRKTLNKFSCGFLISNFLSLLGLKVTWQWGPKVTLPLGNIAILGEKK